MAGLVIDQEKCTGCGLCLKSCAVNALSVKNESAAVSDVCVMCGVCVDVCPFNAILIEKKEAAETEAFLYKDVWVFAEQSAGTLASVSLELTGEGRRLADARRCALVAVLSGKNGQENAKILIAAGADKVIFCPDERLAENNDEAYADYVSGLIEKYKPEAVLFGATKFGRSLAPRVAARVKTGLTADCTVLEIDQETKLLRQTRPAFGGNLMATIVCPAHRPQMATVRPGIMAAPEPDFSRCGELVEETFFARTVPAIELLEKIKTDKTMSIADAQIIVDAGRGIGNQKNLALVKEFADLIGAELGCSRPLVDMGWCEYRHQVGQTGCSVAPKLLITFGVSGAIQHLAGIARAEKIIAVNSDPEAPIFGVAHYAVVGDCVEILKEMIAALKQGGASLSKLPVPVFRK